MQIKYIIKYLSFLLALMSAISCLKMGNKHFTKLSAKETGIRFRNIIKETETFNHLKYSYLYNGIGVAVGDINNDGLPDIFYQEILQTLRFAKIKIC